MGFTTKYKKIVGIDHFINGKSKKATHLNEKDFIHLALNTGGNPSGISPIESLVKSISLYASAIDYNKYLFLTNGVPAMSFILKDGSEDDYRLLQNAVDNIPQGGSFVAKGDIQMEILGEKSSDIGYIQLVEQVYQDVMSVFQIPGVFMSLKGSGSDEGSKVDESAFVMKVTSIQNSLATAIREAFFKIWGDEAKRIEFHPNAWINEKALAAMEEKYLKLGVMTPNDIRKRKGLEPVEWGDVPYNMNAPLGKGLVDPIELENVKAENALKLAKVQAQTFQQNQQESNPKGSNDQAEGRSAEAERPDRPEENSPLKVLMEQNEILLKMLIDQTQYKAKLEKRMQKYFEGSWNEDTDIESNDV